MSPGLDNVGQEPSGQSAGILGWDRLDAWIWRLGWQIGGCFLARDQNHPHAWPGRLSFCRSKTRCSAPLASRQANTAEPRNFDGNQGVPLFWGLVYRQGRQHR